MYKTRRKIMGINYQPQLVRRIAEPSTVPQCMRIYATWQLKSNDSFRWDLCDSAKGKSETKIFMLPKWW